MPKCYTAIVYMNGLCYKNMLIKDCLSLVSCILSFRVTTISETSITGFYYSSICAVTKPGCINPLAVQMSSFLYCLHWSIVQKLKIKSENEILSYKGHCLISAGFPVGIRRKKLSNCSVVTLFIFLDYLRRSAVRIFFQL